MPINQQMMMQKPMFQNQNSLNQNDNNFNSQSSGKEFTVVFKRNFDNNEGTGLITIQCRPDEKVSSLIEKFRNKTDTRKYIYNAKNLNRSLTAAEVGLLSDSIILVSEPNNY